MSAKGPLRSLLGLLVPKAGGKRVVGAPVPRLAGVGGGVLGTGEGGQREGSASC